MQVGTTASVSLLGSVWMLISGLLSAAGGLVGQMVPLRFLGQLLHLWGAPSSIGLQVLLQKLQLVGSGMYVAPPQLEQYRQAVQGVAWATMRWTGQRLAPAWLCASIVTADVSVARHFLALPASSARAQALNLAAPAPSLQSNP